MTSLASRLSVKITTAAVLLLTIRLAFVEFRLSKLQAVNLQILNLVERVVEDMPGNQPGTEVRKGSDYERRI